MWSNSAFCMEMCVLCRKLRLVTHLECTYGAFHPRTAETLQKRMTHVRDSQMEEITDGPIVMHSAGKGCWSRVTFFIGKFVLSENSPRETQSPFRSSLSPFLSVPVFTRSSAKAPPTHLRSSEFVWVIILGHSTRLSASPELLGGEFCDFQQKRQTKYATGRHQCFALHTVNVATTDIFDSDSCFAGCGSGNVTERFRRT